MRHIETIAELLFPLLVLLTAGFVTIAVAFSPTLVSVLAWMHS